MQIRYLKLWTNSWWLENLKHTRRFDRGGVIPACYPALFRMILPECLIALGEGMRASCIGGQRATPRFLSYCRQMAHLGFADLLLRIVGTKSIPT